MSASQASSSNNPSSRGWLEGTLDVISGMRPTTPVRARSITPSKYGSAPNSPATRGSIFGGASRDASPSITRLPSQDSLDRSLHNNSGHGKDKTAAQIIKELRQSNARLTARTAELEADFMNQLSQAQRKFQQAQQAVHTQQQQSSQHIATLENRLKVTESRLKEREDVIDKLKEESAFQRHTISDLKTQLLSSSSPDAENKPNESNSKSFGALEKERLLKEMDLLNDELCKERDDKIHLQQELARLRRIHNMEDDDKKEEDDAYHQRTQLKRTQDALYRTESALAQLQNERKKALTERDEKVQHLEKEVEQLKSQHGSADRGIEFSSSPLSDWPSDWQTQLQQKDEAIEKAREQALEYSSQLTTLQERLSQVKADAEAQEQYRREEADDLRVLTDAQEEEIEELKKQLEDAINEMELREQELEDARSSQEDLHHLKAEVQRVNQEIQNKAHEYEQKISELNRTIADLQEECQMLNASKSTRDVQADDESNQELKERVQTLQTKVSLAEKQYRETREALASAERSQMYLRKEYETKMDSIRQDALETELKCRDKLAEQEKAFERSRQALEEQLHAETNQVKTLMNKIAVIEADDADGPTEEILRELERTRKMKEDLETEVESSRNKLKDLHEKLLDRDTTISTLVKSAVANEEKLEAFRMEIDDLHNQLDNKARGLSGDAASPTRASFLHLKKENERLKDDLKDMRNEYTQLRCRLEAAKSENLLLRSQLEDDNGSNTGSNAGSSVIASNPQLQIQERDNAIANLVQQSIEQDRLVSELKDRIAAMSEELTALRQSSAQDGSQDDAAWEEIRELRKETEIFAGQVIEQDEEIEELRGAIQARENKIAALEDELEELRKHPLAFPASAQISGMTNTEQNIQSLKAEIDELTESNEVLLDEVRLLRQKERQFESSAETIDRLKGEIQEAVKDLEESEHMISDLSTQRAALREEIEVLQVKTKDTENLRQKLRDLEKTSSERISSLESELKDYEEAMENVRLSSGSQPRSIAIDEMEVETLREKIESLQRNFDNTSSALDAANETIRELEQALAETNANASAALEEEKEELLAEVESLSNQLSEARGELKQLEEQRSVIEDFKAKLEDADEAREASEKTIVDTYERKLSLLKLDKDVTIDKLRKELAEYREAGDGEFEAMKAQIERYEAYIEELKQEAATELREREARIFEFEHTLEVQQQLVDNMKTEMDQLQGSMENTAVSRREEIEDMQQELVDLTATVAKQEREIKTLQGRLQDEKIEHDAEVAKLRQTIDSMEKAREGDSHRNAHDLQMEIRIKEVKERLEKLKWRNDTLMEENTNLRDRLLKAEERLSGNKSHEEAVELRQQLEVQTKKVEELESELSRRTAEVLVPVPVPITPMKAPIPLAPSSTRNNNMRAPSPGRHFGFLGRRRANSHDTESNTQ